MPHFAAIDMGSNTFRLLIAEITGPRHIREIYSENRITRLGEGFSEEKKIRPKAAERAFAALVYFQGIVVRKKVDALIVTGTSALREARNRSAFLEEIKQKTGLTVKILTGEEEAKYTLLGVRLIFPDRDEPTVVIDIGGGSTEFIGTNKGNPIFLFSTNLGVVALTEQYLRSDPPSDEEMSALRDAIDKRLDPIADAFPKSCRFVGTAGTVTTLAAMDQKMPEYDPNRINRYQMSFSRINKMQQDFSKMTLEARRTLPGLEKGREDLLVTGTLILMRVMQRFFYDPLYVSDYGLREGILIALLQNGLDCNQV